MEQERNKLFQEAVERLQNGQGLDELLAAYPDLAEELQTVSLLPEARANAAEVRAMRSRLDAQFEEKLASFEISKKASRRPLLALIASIALLFCGLWFFFPRGETDNANEMDLTQSTLAPTETATSSPRPTIATHTANPSPTVATNTANPSPTVATETSSPSPTVATHTANPSPTVATSTPEASVATIAPDSSSEASCTPRTDWKVYIVQSGDTLSEIALNSGTTTEQLQRANCLPSARAIFVGQRIYVPRLWDDAEEDTGDDDDAEEDDDGTEDDDDDDAEDDDGTEDDDDAEDDDPPSNPEDDADSDADGGDD